MGTGLVVPPSVAQSGPTAGPFGDPPWIPLGGRAITVSNFRVRVRVIFGAVESG